MEVYGVFDFGANNALYPIFLRDYPTLDEARKVRDLCERYAEDMMSSSDYRIMCYDGKHWLPVE